MSILTEVQRLSQAKSDLKNSIEKRGAAVPVDNTIDSYPELLDKCPFIVEGTFIPKETTKTFSMSGLPFSPNYLGLCCPAACSTSTSLRQTITIAVKPKNDSGGIGFMHTDGSLPMGFLTATSGAIKWTEDGVTLNIPSSADAFFLKDVTYTYYISGGSE